MNSSLAHTPAADSRGNGRRAEIEWRRDTPEATAIAEASGETDVSARCSANRAPCPAYRRSSPRREGLAPWGQLGQRERERERRVSDADASYYATTTSARTPKHVIPKRNHAKYNPLSKKRAGPSPKVPVKNMLVSTTKTDPDPTLCSARLPWYFDSP